MKLGVGVAMALLVSACSTATRYTLAPGEIDKLKDRTAVLETEDGKEAVEVHRVKLDPKSRGMPITKFLDQRDELLATPPPEAVLYGPRETSGCIIGIGLAGLLLGGGAYTVGLTHYALNLADEPDESVKNSKPLLYWALLWGPLIFAATTGLGYGGGNALCTPAYDYVKIVTE